MTASKIEWTDRSDWNPIRGCTRVSPGCGGPGAHGGCYAEAMAARFSKPGQWGHGHAEMVGGKPRWTGKVTLQEDRLFLPLKWRKPLPGRNKAFPSSTSDIFHESLSDTDIDLIFAVMIMAQDWIFQPLTKRTGRMRDYLSRPRWGRWAAAGRIIDPIRWATLRPIMGDDLTPIPNVWLGVSVEDQQRANERIPDLLLTPAAVRWISAEPLLGPLDLTMIEFPNDRGGIECWDALDLHAIEGERMPSGNCETVLDWVVAGGESGPRYRDNDFEANARSLQRQCASAGVAFFGKQNAGKRPLPDDLLVRQFPA